MSGHERHDHDTEFDLRCDACHARVSRKIRAEVRRSLLAEGLSEEQADEFFADMDRLVAEMKAKQP